MELELGLSGTKERTSIQVNATAYLRMNERTFAVVVPHFDDWLRTVDFDLGACRANVHLWRSPVVIEFQSDSDRKRFAQWVSDAGSQAEKGYTTMVP
jgi:hypothetical protein